MQVEFAKMHGLGNDFVVIDNTTGRYRLEPEQIRTLGDRHRGIGFDQLLVAEVGGEQGADIGLRIFNRDGTEAEQSGNGVRCFALYARERGLVCGPSAAILTGAGVVRATFLPNDRIRVDMGVPTLVPAQIPFVADAQSPRYALCIGGERVTIGAVSLGNPHAVLQVDDVDAAPVGELGPRVQSCGRFPDGVNVGFMQPLGPRQVRLRVYERGAGETLACGSGACAAVVVGRLQELLAREVDVDLPGGRLQVAWEGLSEPVWLTGAAAHVFRGQIEL